MSVDPDSLAAATRTRLEAIPDRWIRRRRLALQTSAPAARIPSLDDVPPGAMGLALSGGGIRSATLSLGLVQALSRRDRLFDFDYLSTVSGGGYFGSFLTSLFVPTDSRGPQSRVIPEAEIRSEAAPSQEPTWRQRLIGTIRANVSKLRTWALRRGAATSGPPVEEDTDLSPEPLRDFVEFVLGCDANEDQISWPPHLPPTSPDGTAQAASEAPAESDAPAGSKPRISMRNPIWWLREHGRYLAPNGPTDYMYAVAFISRNWLAMIYTFLIAASAGFFILTLAAWVFIGHPFPDVLGYLHLAQDQTPSTGILVSAQLGHAVSVTFPAAALAPPPYDLSPFLVVPAVGLIFSTALGIGYWTTVSLDTDSRWSNEKQASPQQNFWRQFGIVVALAFAAYVLCRIVTFEESASSSLLFWRDSWPVALIILAIELTILGVAIAGAVARYTAPRASGDIFTSEIRRRLTKLNAAAINIILWSLAIAMIDTLALAVRRSLFNELEAHRYLTVLPAAAAPAAAWLFSKLPQWLGGGRLARLFGEHIWTVALAAGALLFGLVAVAADLLVQSLAWPIDPEVMPTLQAWLPQEPLNWPVFLPYAAISLTLCAVTGLSNGFVNLSSLHSFYAGRLTRAYLGAANLQRLQQAVRTAGNSPITENHPNDYIDIARYYDCPKSFAPIHLINVTLNETRSRDHSQLVDRDRKGIPLVFGPEGALINAARSKTASTITWDALKGGNVDSLDVGQLCAISGAAASSGMGSRTTLGGALAFTFANVRLGYWWLVNKTLAGTLAQSRVRHLLNYGPIATFYYFFCEMTARYSLADSRVYLSDGGHFENSGAYELLRKRVRVILVADNAQDEHYQFEDLENLVRKARIDLGFALTLASADTVKALFGSEGAELFLNRFGDDWRRRAGEPESGFALLLEVYEGIAAEPTPNPPKQTPVGRVIWLKPKLAAGLPEDVKGYAARNPGFPQQSTADQFFDEAQWESYRAVGYLLGERLMTETFHRANVLRATIPKPTAGAVA